MNFKRVHHLKHANFNMEKDLIKPFEIKNFELFKTIALQENKFIDKLTFICPIIKSKAVRLIAILLII